jgi:uncharacterized membrane protein (DUF106 family)
MSFFDPLFSPILSFGIFWTIFIVSFVLSALITLIYYLMTDQKEMKELKDQAKNYQKEMKKHKDDPKKVMSIQKEALSLQSKLMMKSLKPTLVTMLPVLIIFNWLSASLAYYPISPGDEFDFELTFKDAMPSDITLEADDGLEIISNRTQSIFDNKAKWTLRAKDKGVYRLGFKYGPAENPTDYSYKLRVSEEIGDYEPVEQRIKDGSSLRSMKAHLEVVRPFGSFSFFGWRPNWLWSYIILSMIFSLGLRKLFKIH